MKKAWSIFLSVILILLMASVVFFNTYNEVSLIKNAYDDSHNLLRTGTSYETSSVSEEGINWYQNIKIEYSMVDKKISKYCWRATSDVPTDLQFMSIEGTESYEFYSAVPSSTVKYLMLKHPDNTTTILGPYNIEDNCVKIVAVSDKYYKTHSWHNTETPSELTDVEVTGLGAASINVMQAGSGYLILELGEQEDYLKPSDSMCIGKYGLDYDTTATVSLESYVGSATAYTQELKNVIQVSVRTDYAPIDVATTTAKFSWKTDATDGGTGEYQEIKQIDDYTLQFTSISPEGATGRYYLGYTIEAYDMAGNLKSFSGYNGPYLADGKKPSKPSIDNHTSDEEWTKEDVTIDISSYDSHSGISDIEYKEDINGVTGEWKNLIEWDDIHDNAPEAGDSLETSKTWTEETETSLYLRATDRVGNISEVTTTYIRIDKTMPSITITPNSNTTWSKNTEANVTISDLASGLAAGAKLEYGWSESNTTEPTNYTEANISSYSEGDNSATFIATANGLTGKYYLWVKPVTLQDVAGNIQTTTIKSTGAFYLDNVAPIIELQSEGNSTWSKTVSVPVRIYDFESALAEGMSIKYGWSQSNLEEPSEYVAAIINSYTAGTEFVTFTASASGLTGKYYLWIKPANLSDTTGNAQIQNKISAETFYLDNTKPTLGTLIMKLENSEGIDYTNDTWTNKDVYIEATNGSDAETGETYTTYTINGGEENTEPTTLTNTGTYEIVVKTVDNLGNFSISESYIVKIDKENPISGILTMKLENNEGSDYENDTWTSSNVYIFANNGTDAHSAHKETTYTINGEEEKTGEIIITESGIYEIVVKTTDNAGNIATNMYTIKIDKIAPSVGNLVMKIETSEGVDYTSGTWTSKSIYIGTVNGTDEQSGHSETTYIINDGEEQKDPSIITETGIYEIIVKTKDNVGNVSTSEKYIVNIDKTAPIPGTLIMKKESSAGVDYENDTWTNKSVYIRLVEGTDNETGHKQTTYSINGGEEKTEPITITMVGIHEILVKTEDNVGNMSSRTYLVKIDKAAPTVGTLSMKLEDANGEDYTNGTMTNKNVYIKPINGMDENSGHKETTYTINGGEVQTGENILTETGTYEIVLTTTDNAGNSRTAQYTVKIDKIAPTAGTLIIRQGDSQGPVYIQDTWINQNTYVEVVNGSDAESGHKETVYIIDGGEPQTEPTIITSDGKHEIIVKTTDIAGNTSTNTYIVQIDKMVPTISGITGNRKNTSIDPVILSINGAVDYGIGLAEEPYSFDGGKTWQTENTRKYIENTTGIIIQVKDKLGNIYTYHEKINITSIIVVLVELQIEKLPTKTEYLPHENFSREGMVVKAIYSNGTTTETRNYEVVNQSDLNCLITEVLIRSNENYEVETTCPISVAHEMQDPNCMEPSICKTEGCLHTEGEALGHEFTNYVSNNDATCTKNGTETALCNREGCEAKLTREDDASILPHYYASVIIRETCTEDGYTKHTCIHCQYEYKDNYTDKFGHEFTNYVSDNNATCTNDGTKTAICNRETCNETDTLTDKGTKIPHTYAGGKCTVCGAKEVVINVTSEKYTIEDIYIKDIPNKTTVKDFIANIESEAEEIKVINEDDEEIGEDKNVGTGMILSLKVEGEEKIFKLVVAGDVTGDGKADFSDIIKINKHRLKKSELYGEYLMAADVNGDGKADFSDITKINKYRLNKITQLVSK